MTRFPSAKMSNLLFGLTAVASGMVIVCGALAAETPRLQIERSGETIALEPYAPNIVRVTLSLERSAALAAPGYGLVAAPAASGWAASQTSRDDL